MSTFLEGLVVLEAESGAADFYEGKPLARDTYWAQVGYWIARDKTDPQITMAMVKADRDARGVRS